MSDNFYDAPDYKAPRRSEKALARKKARLRWRIAEGKRLCPWWWSNRQRMKFTAGMPMPKKNTPKQAQMVPFATRFINGVLVILRRPR